MTGKKQYQRSTGTKTLNPKKHSYVDKKFHMIN
jgi:hypothetical protein